MQKHIELLCCWCSAYSGMQKHTACLSKSHSYGFITCAKISKLLFFLSDIIYQFILDTHIMQKANSFRNLPWLPYPYIQVHQKLSKNRVKKVCTHTTWPCWCQPHLLLVISRVRSNMINWWHNFRKENEKKKATSKLSLSIYQYFSLHHMAKVRPAADKYNKVNNIWYHHLYSFRS